MRKKSALALLMGTLMLMGMMGCTQKQAVETKQLQEYSQFEDTVKGIKTKVTTEQGTEALSLDFWYTDAKCKDYYEAAAADFHQLYGVEVNCVYQSQVEYLNHINQSIQQDEGPDLFANSNDEVQKMQMAGLIAKNALYEDEFWEKYFSTTAKRALTSNGVTYGYPIYMDTCLMAYNKALTTEPENFASITDFAVNFEDETNTKVIFRWDISDPFCNFIFLGPYADILGEYGEDKHAFTVNNAQVAMNMTYYQSLHDYFSLDLENSTYDQIYQEIQAGNLLYAIVKTDMISKCEGLEQEYGFCQVPDLSVDLETQNLSVTQGVFVNPYTKNKEYANLFAAYLATEYSGQLYPLTGLVSVNTQREDIRAGEQVALAQYDDSAPMPKALMNGDFWLHTEMCFKNIWSGSDVSTELDLLQAEMQHHLQ